MLQLEYMIVFELCNGKIVVQSVSTSGSLVLYKVMRSFSARYVSCIGFLWHIKYLFFMYILCEIDFSVLSILSFRKPCFEIIMFPKMVAKNNYANLFLQINSICKYSGLSIHLAYFLT